MAYGAITTDGRQFIRTCDKFDKETVLKYLKELTNHFGKVVIIMDNAPQHKAGNVKKFLKEDLIVKSWLLTATPELSGVEEEY